MSISNVHSTSGQLPAFMATDRMNSNRPDRKMIVIQLSGGNDGLNTIIPYRNDIYYRQRPIIGIKANQIISLTDDIGFHPSMQGMKDLYDAGEMAIINQVGYPNPDRSHFKSMDFWHTAGNFQSGWIGRYLDEYIEGQPALTAVEISDVLSLALRGNRSKGVAMDNLPQLYQDLSNQWIQEAIQLKSAQSTQTNLDYVYSIILDAKKYIDPAFHQYQSRTNFSFFGNTQFDHQMKIIAEMISSGIDTQIYYASLGTFDTHVEQTNKHNQLLKTLSCGVSNLVKALKQIDQFKNVCIMIFSEFGRRVKQNGSKGTDHGAGNSMYIISPSISRQGLFNPYTDLMQLHNGDVEVELDFRQVYATLLEDWLSVDSMPILGTNYAKLDLFSSLLA